MRAHCAKANWVRSQLLQILMRSNTGENTNCVVTDNDDDGGGDVKDHVDFNYHHVAD